MRNTASPEIGRNTLMLRTNITLNIEWLLIVQQKRQLLIAQQKRKPPNINQKSHNPVRILTGYQ
jgi:hypothetical protein